MEILALLLLGLIAMLAIVPPIIRGKLDESPLATTQSFQRSMQEMANSIEPRGSREEDQYRSPGTDGNLSPGSRDIRNWTMPGRLTLASRRKTAVRRNRITMGLTVFAAIWGIAALISGRGWCLVLFVVVCSLLVVYWGLVLIIPSLLPRSQTTNRPEEAQRYPHSQAL